MPPTMTTCAEPRCACHAAAARHRAHATAATAGPQLDCQPDALCECNRRTALDAYLAWYAAQPAATFA